MEPTTRKQFVFRNRSVLLLVLTHVKIKLNKPHTEYGIVPIHHSACSSTYTYNNRINRQQGIDTYSIQTYL